MSYDAGNLDVWLSGLRVAVRLGNLEDATLFCDKIKTELLSRRGVTEEDHRHNLIDMKIRINAISAAEKIAQSLDLGTLGRDMVASLIYTEMKK